MNQDPLIHVVVGGGAAGFFGAIACADAFPSHTVYLLEKTRQPLAKVRISGGGRCNVTHACFDPAVLVKSYPRGYRELLGPFHQFQPRDTVQWFEKRGVALKTEEDGRMFPVTDSSETIIDCLHHAARKTGVNIRLETGVQKIEKEGKRFRLSLQENEELVCDRLLMATGSTSKIFPLMEHLGHTIVPLVPSLFTFNIPDSPFIELAGISVDPVNVKLINLNKEQRGPLLITHWGLSGPAVLKLSSWAAPELHQAGYHTAVEVNWLPDWPEEKLLSAFTKMKQENPAKQVGSDSPFPLPRQLWKKFLQLANIDQDLRWSAFSNKQQQQLKQLLRSTQLKTEGKTTYKQEFVTCGGINLKEVNFKTMESRLCPGLFFAGEILNIDGITGGFNFQNAWSTGWIAGHAMGIIGN